jgi:hypothetical protein
MRVSRFLLLAAGVTVLGACDDNDVVTTQPQNLARVRYVNALPDTGNVDIRMVDGPVANSPFASNLAFRGVTDWQGSLADRPRQIRVFNYGTTPELAATVLVDTTITFEANVDYTLVLTGSAVAGTQQFVVYQEEIPRPPAGQVALRVVHAAPGAGNVDAYLSVAPDTLAPGPTPAVGGVAPFAVSDYLNIAPAMVKAFVTAAGTTTVLASATGPAGNPNPGNLINPVAGTTAPGSALSAFVFPASTPGTAAPQTAAFRTPGIVYFVDRHPVLGQ